MAIKDKPKKTKITKEERKEMLKEFKAELQNKNFDPKVFENKNFGTSLPVQEEQIQKYFNETTQQENSAKELFDVKGDVRTRTELSPKQIGSVVKLKYLSKELDFPELDTIAEDFMYCMISKNRQSRKEFVDVHKSQNELGQGSGFFGRVKNMFGGGNNGN